MARFTVYRNANPETKSAVPLLLDVQSDIVDVLGTRVVVPLRTKASMKGRTIRVLTPILDVEGKAYVMDTPQMAGVARSALGQRVADLSGKGDEILAAIDLLLTGF